MRAAASLAIAAIWATPALAQQLTIAPSAEPRLHVRTEEPRLQVGRNSFALPAVHYVASDGSLKRSHGIVIGREVGPNAAVGLGLFRIRPRQEDSSRLTGGKSRNVAVGLSVRF